MMRFGSFIFVLLQLFSAIFGFGKADMDPCYMGNQRDKGGAMRWILSKTSTQCNQILPGGIKNGVIDDTDVWILKEPFFTRDNIEANKYLQDLDPCLFNRCVNDGRCKVIDGAAYCECMESYTGVNCENYDPCFPNPCFNGGTCHVVDSEVLCQCIEYYIGVNCEHQDIDECILETHQCDVHANCSNTVSSYACECISGFNGTGFTCQDIDECVLETDKCDLNANCDNTNGSYSCYCKAGFNGTGFSCQDIDECTTETDQCDVNANCRNIVGKYSCICKSGFIGNGFYCQDIDECTTETDQCDINANCRNTMGSYSCICKSGFTGTGVYCLVCPATWTVKDNSCFRVFTTMMTWESARDYCQSFGNDAHLADITNEEENDLITELMPQNVQYWIGLNDVDVEGTWTWVSGDNSQYVNWKQGEPNSYADWNEDCVGTHKSLDNTIWRGYWSDLRCESLFAFICEQ